MAKTKAMCEICYRCRVHSVEDQCVYLKCTCPEQADEAAVDREYICVRCKKPIGERDVIEVVAPHQLRHLNEYPGNVECVEPQADTPIPSPGDVWTIKPDTSLQLLVIDLGDSCVVKVEKGEQFIFNTLPIPSVVVHQVHGPVILNVPFATVREAIDSKPVPRIERDDDHYCFYAADRTFIGLNQQFFDALCEIAGHPPPIWTGGVWEQVAASEQDGGWTGSPVGIWRYTR